MKTKSVIKKSAMIPTALIAGGAGFIGSYLSEALLNKGARVIVLDNFKTGKQSYVNHLISNPNFALYDCDINDGIPEDIQSVDYIFHLAGLEEYSYAKEVIDLTSLLTNALGTKNLLDLSQKSEAKFLLLSTTDVYEGRMSQLELSEYFGRSKIEENRYMLAEAKRYAEALVWEYYKKTDVDARIVRVPEVFGPRMNVVSTGNLGRFIAALVSSHDLTVYGEGSDKEFYLYIDDAISGILKAMYNDKTKGNIFSLIPQQPVSILELAYLIKSVADSSIQVKFENDKPEGYFKPGVLKRPDTFNLQLLKWEPKIALKDGITKALESLNYSPNTYSFKPAKLIEQKIAEQNPAPELFTLQDVKEPITTVNTPYIASVAQTFPSSEPILPKKEPVQMPHIKIPTLPNFPKIPKLRLPSSRKATIALYILSIFIPAALIFIGLPVVNFYVNAKSAVKNLKEVKSSASVFSTDAVKKNAKESYDSFYRANSSLVSMHPLFQLVGKDSQYKSLNYLLASLTNFSKAIYIGAKGTGPLENLWEVIRPDTPDEINSYQFSEAKNNFESARNSLLLAQADFKYVTKSDLPVKYQHYYEEYSNVLTSAYEGFDVAVPVFASLPELLGSSKTHKYLILFQNSNEIRPTGGFIGSYGLLTLEKGKIKDLLIDDIYNPDGQIDQRNILSTVPKPIEDFLKESKLHLRNANWDPDYPQSANAIEDLYYKVTGERIDGVIAIDLYFIRNLLEATGPIYLSAYNEEVNSQNIYERAEMHSEFNYKEGSDQKRSFLTMLGSKLLERLFSLDRSRMPQLGDAFLTSLNQKHLLVYLTNDPLNNLLQTKHWDGSLVATPGDYLYVIDANLGGTKANYYVKKSMNYEVSSLTRDGVLRATLKLEYDHTGKDIAWPGGPYTNYLRVITQNGAKLTGASIMYDSQGSQGIFDKIISNTEGRYSTFETSFVLQPQSKVTVTFNYDLSPSLSFTKDNTQYSLFWQKQPGTQDEQANFLMNKPFGFSIKESSPFLTLTGDSLQMTGPMESDRSLYVKLQ